jgi:carbonic anhydrase/acetyltransferase-like protein (isoleucine patch superfamily)
MKKYKLTGETKEIGGVTLHRIRALIDIPEHDVKAGDLGGWIEAERNLSQKGAAWVADSALVTGAALVTDDARVMDSARVTGLSLVAGNACVMGNARVMGTARVTDSARVTDEALVTDSADYIPIGAIGSRDDTTTFYRGKDGKIYVSCGCFNGTIDDFAAEVKQVHAGTKHERTYLLAIELAKAQIATEEES